MKKEIKSNISGAIRRTLTEMMEKDPSIFLLGEDIADPYGGIHNVTKGIQKHVEPERVINTPLSEVAIAGAATGAAIAGMRPVAEIMYADFLPICMDQIVNQAAKAHFLSGGKLRVPMVIRANYGSGKGEGAQHSQDPLSWLMNYPGVKIVAPATAREAQGLMMAAIQDDTPSSTRKATSSPNKTRPCMGRASRFGARPAPRNCARIGYRGGPVRGMRSPR